MAYVANHIGAAAYQLPPAVKVHPRGSPAYCLGNVVVEVYPYQCEGGKDGAQVLPLVAALEVHLREHCPAPIPSGSICGVSEMERRFQALRLLFEDGGSFVISAADQCRHSFLENSGLFCGNLRACITQKRAMVEADAGDDGEQGSDDIRAVEPAAQARFQYCNINFAVIEPLESHSCGDFEKGEGKPVEVFPVAADEVLDFLFANQFGFCPGFSAVYDSHPFSEVENVGRGIETNT